MTCALGPGDGRRGAVRDDQPGRSEAARVRPRRAAQRRRGPGRAGGDARRSFHEARCAVEALALGMASTAGDGSSPAAGAPRIATYKDLGSFQLLLSLQDDEALRTVLRLDPRTDRSQRGALRRRADALARGVHRRERPVGAGGSAAVLPSAHAAISDTACRGVDGAQPRQCPGPHRVLAGACGEGSWSHETSPQLRRKVVAPVKVGVPSEVKPEEYWVALTPAGVRELVDAGHEVNGRAGPETARPSRGDTTSRARRSYPTPTAVRRGAADRQGQGTTSGRGRASAAPHAVHVSPSSGRFDPDPGV